MSESNRNQEGCVIALGYFDRLGKQLVEIIAALGVEDEQVTGVAQQKYQLILEDCAYLDAPKNVLADALFTCNVHLAAYLALQELGHEVTAHNYGSAMLDNMQTNMKSWQAQSPEGELDIKGPGTHPGEFQIQQVKSDKPGAWGYNITGCAICHHFGKHEALELVPYMCAMDDVVSDKGGQGLRRTGTIALGAHQCDFRYDSASQPLRVADSNPDKIKFIHDLA